MPKTHCMNQSGQVLLITLLVLSISTTIALSLISRTTTDILISNESEESARAFSAAEAGIEKSLNSGLSTGVQTLTTNDASYEANLVTVGAEASPYVFSQPTSPGSSDVLWLVNHDVDGSLIETPTYTSNALDICWTTADPKPAVLVTLYFKDGITGNYHVWKRALDPDSSRSISNNFETINSTGSGCGQNNVHKYTLSITPGTMGIDPTIDTLLMARLRPLHSPTLFFADPGVIPLPAQGRRIESTGTTEAGLARKIIAHQEYRSPAAIFDTVVVSQSSF